MSFYGYTQLINVNDWKIDKEYPNLASVSPDESIFGKFCKINYNLDDGYQNNYNTDKEGANKENNAFV